MGVSQLEIGFGKASPSKAHLVPKVDHSSQEIRLKIVLTGRQNYSPYGCPLHAAWIREKYSLNTICQKCKLDPLPSHYQSVSGYQAPTGIRNSPNPQKCNRNPKGVECLQLSSPTWGRTTLRDYGNHTFLAAFNIMESAYQPPA